MLRGHHRQYAAWSICTRHQLTAHVPRAVAQFMGSHQLHGSVEKFGGYAGIGGSHVGVAAQRPHELASPADPRQRQRRKFRRELRLHHHIHRQAGFTCKQQHWPDGLQPPQLGLGQLRVADPGWSADGRVAGRPGRRQEQQRCCHHGASRAPCVAAVAVHLQPLRPVSR